MHKKVTIPYGDEMEFFKGKDKGDIYIKVPKESNIEVDVSVMYPVEIKSLNELSDEYHSINELYEFRKYYNALLFNEWATEHPAQRTLREGHNATFNDNQQPIAKYDVHKSWRHNDGELCFGGGWFIVVAMLPSGQITNHYKAGDWDLFQIPVTDKAKYEFDGHTPQDTLVRMKDLLTK